MKFFLTALLRAFRKEMGRSPNPGEMDALKRKASEMEQGDKVIPFPPGGKDKVDPFKDRPNVTKDVQELKQGFGDNIRSAYKQAGRSRGDAKEMIEAMDSPGGREATKIMEKSLGMKLYGDETFEELTKIKETGKHPRGEPKAEGGIMGLAEGGPPNPDRRRFMKILGGLASIPVVGRFIKPVAEVAPVVSEGIKTVPSYFFSSGYVFKNASMCLLPLSSTLGSPNIGAPSFALCSQPALANSPISSVKVTSFKFLLT